MADDVIVQEVLQDDQAKRAAESKKKGCRVDHLPVGRHRPAANHHGLVDNAFFNHIGCDGYARLGAFFKQVIVYIVAEVVPPLNLNKLSLVPGETFQLGV